jgi:hypothetical protein
MTEFVRAYVAANGGGLSESAVLALISNRVVTYTGDTPDISGHGEGTIFIRVEE